MIRRLRSRQGVTPRGPDSLADLLGEPLFPAYPDPESGDKIVLVDHFIAFACDRGHALDGLESRLDHLVRRIGGRRIDPPSGSGTVLPRYRLPTSDV